MSRQRYPPAKIMYYRSCINDYSYPHSEGIQQLKHRSKSSREKAGSGHNWEITGYLFDYFNAYANVELYFAFRVWNW